MANTTMANVTMDNLPFDWYIRPVDKDIVCPSPSRILGTFAIINGAVSLFSIFAGHSAVVKFFTCGLMGKGDGKPWRYMWLLPVTVQLLANLLIAWMMKQAHGYDTHYAIWELMLFYTARPRLTFIGLAVASLLPDKSKSKGEYQSVRNQSGSQQHLVQPPWASTNSIPNMQNMGDAQHHPMQPWTSSCISNMIGEVFLQLIALYTIGTTVRHGVMNGYYIFRTDEYDALAHFNHVFYGGALYYLVAAMFFLVVALVSLWEIDTRKHPRDRKRCIILAVVMLVTTWLGSWLFWAGFVFSAGKDYCPPNLTSHAVIWSVFSSIGIFFGVGP